MCGIAAVFAYHYAAAGVDRDELLRIRDHMRRRGPDGKGAWYSQDGRVALAHRRLAIIDPTERAAQPMLSEDGRVVVSFNGEIYNYRELREELRALGHRFQSDSDTEVILRLYQQHGIGMLTQLRGMFALAIWDGRAGCLYLARDPYGIKPLYYADDGWTVRVASQVKAILAGGGVSRAPEPAGQVGFFLFGSVPEPFTTYQEIRAVPAGTQVRIDATGVSEPVKFFSVAQLWEKGQERPMDLESVRERLREALDDTVRHHLVADVPVGAFLSAGIDSGVLASLMNRHGQEANSVLRTVTLAFDEFQDRDEDESLSARQVAEHLATEHSEYRVSAAEFKRELPTILKAMDQPSIDGVNTWFVSKAASEAGLKVAVSGLGGDELFGGYPSFRLLPRWVAWLRWLAWVPGLGDSARILGQGLGQLMKLPQSKAVALLKYGGSIADAYFLKRSVFLPWELPTVMDPDRVRLGLQRLGRERLLKAQLSPEPGSDFSTVAVLESTMYMRNQLLRDSDWASMAHSLEIRTPLVDVPLARALAPVMQALTVGTGKQLLAENLQGFGDQGWARRPKTGFNTALPFWLDELGADVLGVDTSGIAGHWSRRWASMVFHAECAEW